MLYARFCAKHFVYANVFDLCNDLYDIVTIIHLILQLKIRRSKLFNNSPKVTKLVSSGDGVHVLVWVIAEPVPLTI